CRFVNLDASPSNYLSTSVAAKPRPRGSTAGAGNLPFLRLGLAWDRWLISAAGRLKFMVLVHLMAALQKARPFRAPVLVVVISALLALLFTIATQSGEPEPPRAAGEAAMHLVTDEH